MRLDEWKQTATQREVKIAITRPLVSLGLLPGQSLLDDVVTFHDADGRQIMPTSSGVGGGATPLYSATLPLSATVGRIRVTCLKQFEVADFPVVFENVPLP